MERELVELFEAAKKAADAAAVAGTSAGGPEESRCLDALKHLRNFPVSYKILVSSQVGKKLRHLTKHPRKKIKDFASELIELWKIVIMEETAKSKKYGNSGSDNSIKSETMSTETAPTVNAKNGTIVNGEKAQAVKVERIERNGMQKSGKIIKSETIKVENKEFARIEKTSLTEKINVQTKITEEKQTSETMKPSNDNIAPLKLPSMLKCGDAVRDKVRELLSEALTKVSSEVYEGMMEEVGACDPFRIAVSVESAMFEKWGRSNGVQKSKYRSIMFNLKDPNNPDFRRKVLLGEVKPDMLLEMSVEEMASDQRQYENAKIKEKALFECERGQAPKASTNEFKCRKCGKRECTYYQMQIRSADEPMTTFVTCCNCNNRWKFC